MKLTGNAAAKTTDYYKITKDITSLYSLLQDDLSKDIFWARLRCDAEWENKYSTLLVDTGGGIPKYEDILNTGGKIFLYGAGDVGQRVGSYLIKKGIDFEGFCDRNYGMYAEGFLGKQVFSPQYLLDNTENTLVFITTYVFYDEIYDYLISKGFPRDQILQKFYDFFQQYFDFPGFFKKGTAFVDAGCYDGASSIKFAEWCNNEYSEILAFEPDPLNYKKCEDNLKGLDGVRLFAAGMGERALEKNFFSRGNGSSRFADTCSIADVSSFEQQTINVLPLDDLAEHTEVGFIKLDVEGSEMDALQGAEKTIRRDKPLIAACVYHKPGDTLEIMDYINSLGLGYRFWLRHYSFFALETVLYAAAEK